jgi:hypothetical protein
MIAKVTILLLLAFGGRPRGNDLASALSGEAKGEYEQASKLFRTGDHAGALRSYTRAYELQADPRLLYNMAVCEKSLRHYAKAIPLVTEFLERGASLLTAAQRREAEEFARALRTLVGEVTLECSPPEATILIDEERREEACRSPILLDAGDHRVRAESPHHLPQLLTVNVPGGGARQVAVLLKPEPKQGKLTILAERESAITIDQQQVGYQSWSGVLPAGDHTLRVTAPDRVPHEATISLRHDDDQTLHITLEEEPAPIWPWIVGGAGVVVLAGAATGAYFLLRPGTEEPIEGTLGTHELPP